MIPSMISRRPKWPLILMVVAFGAFAIVAASPIREPILRAAGWALVANDPVTSADIIVISADAGPAGALQAADLVQGGIASRDCGLYRPPDPERRGPRIHPAGGAL